MATTSYKSKFTGEQVDSVVEKVLNQKQQANLTKVTYEELKTLVTNKELVPGCYYEMTDFKQIFGTDYNLTPINIVLLALNSGILSSEVSIVPKEGFAKSQQYIIDGMQEYEGYKAYYSLDIIDTKNIKAGSTGQITKMVDTFNNVEFYFDYISYFFNNKIYYKFENIKFGKNSNFELILINEIPPCKLYIHDITVGHNTNVNILPFYVETGNEDSLLTASDTTTANIDAANINIVNANELELIDVQLKNIRIGNNNNIYLCLSDLNNENNFITDINGNKIQCKIENVTVGNNNNNIYIFGYAENIYIGNECNFIFKNYAKNVTVGNNNNNFNNKTDNIINTYIKPNTIQQNINYGNIVTSENYNTTIYKSKDGILMVVAD